MKIFILLGSPGAGKGTQAKLLQEKFGFVHIATGDLFRDHLVRQTDLGKLAQSYIQKGDLVPDEVTVNMVQERFQKDDCSQGVILDGFPRNLFQADRLDSLLDKYNLKIDKVFYIWVEPSLVIKRILNRSQVEGREDDSKEIVESRLKIYGEQTLPLVNFYKGKGLLERVDGSQNINEVFVQLVNLVSN